MRKSLSSVPSLLFSWACSSMTGRIMRQAAFTLQRYLDRYYKAREDHVRFLLARIYQREGDTKKSADFINQLKHNPGYEQFLKR